MDMVDESFRRTGIPFPLLIQCRGEGEGEEERKREVRVRATNIATCTTHKLSKFGYFMWSASSKDNASPTEVCESVSVSECE